LSTAFIRETTKQHPDKPFFVYIGTPAAHGPFTPAPQYQHTYDGVRAPRTPNWNHRGVDKHWMIRYDPEMTEKVINQSDTIYGHRLATLRSVDDLVAELFATLEETGTLDNTYIIYGADNGFHSGQFCAPSDKRQHFEHEIRVPFAITGPGVREGIIANQMVVNVDWAPTMIDLMGLEPPSFMDGASVRPLIMESASIPEATVAWRKDFLISYHGESRPNPPIQCSPELQASRGAPPASHCMYPHHVGDMSNNTYNCLRTEKIKYCRFVDDEDFVEYYDLESDYWELNNIEANLDKKTRHAYEQRLRELMECSGESCRKQSNWDESLVI